MLDFQLPAHRFEVASMRLVFPEAGPGLVAYWCGEYPPATVAAWDDLDRPPAWRVTGEALYLSSDGEWVSAPDGSRRAVTVTRVGARDPAAVVVRGGRPWSAWTAVAPGGSAVAWKDGPVTVVHALPGGEPVARVDSGPGYEMRFSPGGRWLTESGDDVFRVLDRADGYRAVAGIRASDYALGDVADGPTAVVRVDPGVVAVWDLAADTATATLPIARRPSALALSADGLRVLVASWDDGVTLWDVASGRVRRYDWGIKMPVAVALARDGTRAAVGEDGGRVVIWDLDD